MDPLHKTSYVLETLSKGEKTRLHILNSSIDCFANHGFENASFTELAKSSNVNRALILHYFQSKEKLISECLNFVRITGKSFIELFLKQNEHISNQVDRYTYAYFDWCSAHHTHASFLVLSFQRAAYDIATRKSLDQILHLGWRRIEQLIKSSPEDYKMDSATRKSIAKQIHAQIIGTLLLITAHPKKSQTEDRDRCVQATRAILSNYFNR